MTALRVVRHAKYAAQSAACRHIRQARETGDAYYAPRGHTPSRAVAC